MGTTTRREVATSTTLTTTPVMVTRVIRDTRVTITTKRATMVNTVRNTTVASTATMVVRQRNTTTRPDIMASTIRERRGIREPSTVRRVDIRRATRHMDIITSHTKMNFIRNTNSTMTIIREDITASTATSMLITRKRRAATRRVAITSPATMTTITERRVTMTRVTMKMNIRVIRATMVMRSTMGTMRTTARRVVILMANTGDTAVVTEVVAEVVTEVVTEVVITKEWATHVYSHNTYVSAVQFQCSVSSEMTFKEVAAHSTIILTLYFTLLWIKEGQ